MAGVSRPPAKFAHILLNSHMLSLQQKPFLDPYSLTMLNLSNLSAFNFDRDGQVAHHQVSFDVS